jgi:hypothetical protein
MKTHGSSGVVKWGKKALASRVLTEVEGLLSEVIILT